MFADRDVGSMWVRFWIWWRTPSVLIHRVDWWLLYTALGQQFLRIGDGSDYRAHRSFSNALDHKQAKINYEFKVDPGNNKKKFFKYFLAFLNSRQSRLPMGSVLRFLLTPSRHHSLLSLMVFSDGGFLPLHPETV